ncbi:MAG: aminopeptidase [Planctomycetota bacterium]|jgi:aminopeptidase
MNRSHLENYAELAVDACIGLKDPRGLLIHGEVPHREVALVFAEAAQQRTQAPVRILLDDSLDFARIIRGGQLDQIEAANRPLRAAFDEVIQNHWAVVALRGEEDLELMGRLAEEHAEAFDVFTAGRSDAITMWRKYGIGRGYCPWILVGVPTASLARAAFPDRNEPDGIEALWELWFKFTFADQGNCLEEAKAHWAKLNARARLLNDIGIREVHVVGPGTDLRVGFHELANWLSGPKPGDLQPGPNNHPTEESFTTSNRGVLHDA